MDKSTTLDELRDMKESCKKQDYCSGCFYRFDCDAYTDENAIDPVNWKLPTGLSSEITLEELTKAHMICNSCLEGCGSYHPVDYITEECPFYENGDCQYDKDSELRPHEWVLPKCEISNPSLRDFDTLREPDTVKLVGLAGVPTDDLLRELERRQVSPEMMNQFAIERKAAKFKTDHLDIIKAAVTIHNYCESTADARENDCRCCLLYNQLKASCGVNWSEKDLDENILELCKDGTII